MLPRDLTVESFVAYPPLGKAFAIKNLSVLIRLPSPLAPMLLREIISYDYKFPAERADLERQFAFLAALSPERFKRTIDSFTALVLSPEMARLDWVNQPSLYVESASAQLWATGQIESFRKAAIALVASVNEGAAEAPAPVPRLAIVMIGQGSTPSGITLFRKLAPHGTHFTNVDNSAGLSAVASIVGKRANATPSAYRHWYVDGGTKWDLKAPAVTSLSYEEIRPLRAALQDTIRKARVAQTNSEDLRTKLAQMQPADFGLNQDPLMDRFRLSLLTEGSGTQVFSTTFAQWAAREVLRRAQPYTLLLRFASRQRDRDMIELLKDAEGTAPLDPEGSLRDSDLGAYYTWLNLQRLEGAANSRFAAVYEAGKEAIVIAPGIAKATRSMQPTTLGRLLSLLE